MSNIWKQGMVGKIDHLWGVMGFNLDMAEKEEVGEDSWEEQKFEWLGIKSKVKENLN